MNANTAKICIWGFRNGRYDTFRHIHEAFYRTLKFMGRNVIWVDRGSDLSGIDWKDTFFLSQNIVFERDIEKIPLREDCFYCVHNGFPAAIWPAIKGLKTMGFLVMWATDLLPPEIEANKPSRVFCSDSKVINYVGSLWEYNREELGIFGQISWENGILFRVAGSSLGPMSIEENVRLIRESYMAPALQGSYQIGVNYIPCRLWKNISYGQWPVVNSRAAYEVVDGQAIFNSDCRQLFLDAQKKLPQVPLADLYRLMDFVAEKHTYLNRLKNLFAEAQRILEEKS